MSTSLEVEFEIEPSPKKEFMAKFDRYEPVIKSSSHIRVWKECKRKFFYEVVLARKSPIEPPYFAWGSAYHLFREVLENEYGLAQASYDEQKAIVAFQVAIQKGIAYWNKNGKEQEADTKFGFMNVERLNKSFIAAFRHWAKEKQQGRIQVIATEQILQVKLSDGSSTSIRADQLIKWNGQLWGRDFKTTTKEIEFYKRSLEPNDQFTRYTLVESKSSGERVSGQFVEVLWNQKPTKDRKSGNIKLNGPEIHELMTHRTPTQLAIFEQEQVIQNRQMMISRETDIWPMEESSCPFCPFHSVCQKQSEAGMMLQLEQHFVVKPWNNALVDPAE